MSVTKDSLKLGELAKPTHIYASVTEDSLRGHYVRTSISATSRAAELGRYLNIDETTFSTPKDTGAHVQGTRLESIVANSGAKVEYLRIPEPIGGVQRWWAQLLHAAPSSPQPEVHDHSTMRVTAL